VEETPLYAWVKSCTLIALFMPLISFTLSLVISKRYAWIVSITAPMLMLLSALFACMTFISLEGGDIPFAISLDWFTAGTYKFSAGIALDNHSVIMLPVVTIISFLVHFYSIGYMAGDKSIRRYFAMLGFFTFAMLGIVMADNLLLIFVFWELVGFSSYLLIGHWMEKPKAASAASKAFIFNRIGDAGFLIGLMIIWANTNSFALTEMIHHPEIYSWQTAASLCVFCGVIGKSAQFPLLTWLPDAMEGPTPVSALIHAATMVAAGVFLLAKIFPLFTPVALNVIAITGALTSFMAAIAALVQHDIKKILAYSTISQLGFMVLAIGTGGRTAAMMHLFTHAFFKAGLFLGAGAIIHTLHQLEQQTHMHFDVQDIRNLGGLKKYLPVTFITFVICSAALAGLPMFSGFLSKDAILTGVWVWGHDGLSWKWILIATAFGIPFLTVVYTFRMVWLIFLGENRTKDVIGHPVSLTEAPAVMRLPLIVLATCSLWFVASLNPFDYSGWLHSKLHEGKEFHFHFITIFSALWVFLALGVAYFCFRSKSLKNIVDAPLLSELFFLDRFYRRVIVDPIHKLSMLTVHVDSKWIDRSIHFAAYAQVTIAHVTGWIDKIFINGSVNGVARLAGNIGSVTRSFQGGKIQLYIFWAVFGIIIFLISMLI
jgi:NADH-quinone oxidoreductase subunit L